jgi:cell division septum initiation protein DivIVA
MAQSEGYAERAERSTAANRLVFPEMAEMGKKRIENFVDAQRELLNQVQETNRQWFDRMQSEAKVTSDCANKVMAARSIPEAMTACQEWANRTLEMTAEDAKHFFSDGQKFMEASTRLLSSGLSGDGRSGPSP